MAKPNEAEQPKPGGFRVEVSRERVALPNGREITLDIVHHPGAAAVVPFLAEDEVVLIRQFRHAAGGTILEVPAGKLDAGEPPERCAARELTEEAGYRAGRLVALGSIWTTPGFTDEKIHLFLAHELKKGTHKREADEFMEVHTRRWSEAMNMIRNGQIEGIGKDDILGQVRLVADLFNAAA